MFQDGNNVTKDCDAHVSQVVLRQLTQHVRLDTVLGERRRVVTGVRWRHTGVEEKPEPHCCEAFATL